MGVQGLWSLLQPAARPIKLEDLEGKRFAVDSSIWLYHFRMAMRDKEGRTLANAHILGFFWRICKLLHFGLRPVFVFDGGAPVMKRQTLIGRKTRRAGAKESHALAAKKLLNAQLRQAAIEHVAAQGPSAAMSERPAGEDEMAGLGSNVVYFDDYDHDEGSSSGRPPIRQPQLHEASRSPVKSASPSKAAGKKNIDYHRDPYALPELDQDISHMTASSSKATDARGKGGPRKGRRNDFRFATDAELRHLLTTITPSDIDMSSPLFRSLPSELQYELVGDMRAASRGTSYKRLQSMLQTSPTPIDFSKAQVANLKTRNELTQRVFEVTDEIGDAHIKVPIRVAGERNREYVLVRREGDEGGFVLGVRNQEGTSKEKAIVVGADPERLEVSSSDDEDGGHRYNSRQAASRRTHNDDDDDIALDEVQIPQSASPTRRTSQTASRSPSNAFKASDANNPEARRALAEQLLTKRAEEHIREKLREKGIINEDEVLEEQLKAAQARLQESGKGGDLFSRRRQQSVRGARAAKGPSRKPRERDQQTAAALNAYYDQEDMQGEVDVEDPSEDEDRELAVALVASKEMTDSAAVEISDDEDPQQYLGLDGSNASGSGPEQAALENFTASEYASLYDVEDKTVRKKSKVSDDADEDADMEDVDITDVPPSAVQPSDNASIDSVAPKVRIEPGKDRSPLARPDDLEVVERARSEEFKSQWERPEGEKVETPLVPDAKAAESKRSSGGFKVPASPISKPSLSPAKAVLPIKPTRLGGSPLKQDISPALLKKMKPKQSLKQPSRVDPAAEAAAPPRTTQPKPEQPIDSRGRPMPDMEPLPLGDDLAATAILNGGDDVAEQQAATLTSVPVSAAESVDTQQPEGIKAEPVDDPARTFQVTPEPIPEVFFDETQDTATPMARGASAQAQTVTRPSEINMPTVGNDPDPSAEASALEPSAAPSTHLPLYTHGSHSTTTPPRSPSPSSETGKRDRDDGTPFEWSPSASPEPVTLGADGFPLPTAEELDQLDAEYEAEAQALRADQSDIASFISNAKGQGLIEARAQLAREVEALKAEHINTKKSEEEITRQMAREIQMMLRLFGLPYITAPMEAEAQCAELVSRKLVDGIITDDSDVFLFGGTRVYKNMFNNNKVVECFLLSDIQRELGLDREKLVRLAYLLGSDYTEGLPSVGPVVAMEILSLFTGRDGLLRFKDWWLKVQSGKDSIHDTKGKTMRRIKKTLASKVHLNEEWPNPAVLDAYYEPSVDSSEEPFQWGLPDLDNLRAYLGEYLGWSTTKTDQYVVPVIEAQSRRSRARGNQSTLDRNGFFDLSGGTGVYAGRTLPKYGSSRLQNVVDGFRAANRRRGENTTGRSRESQRQPLAQRGEAQVLSSDEEVDSPRERAATYVDMDTTEENLGREMAKSRPIVRKEQMRVSRGEADRELEANIVALEGDQDLRGSDQPAQGKGRKRTAATRGGAAKKRGQRPQRPPDAGSSDDGAQQSQASGDDPSFHEGTTSRPQSRKRGANRGRGGQRKAATSAGQDAVSEEVATETSQGQPSKARGSTARKPARARGARGRGGRHPHLSAGRSMRLDGPIPESSAQPIRPGREEEFQHQQQRLRSMSRSTSASSLAPSGQRVTPSARGSADPSSRSQRTEIALDDDSDEGM
ncbi:unnamed protein product [Parajaminaea phylloscopi]